jgi:uncharacterized protein
VIDVFKENTKAKENRLKGDFPILPFLLLSLSSLSCFKTKVVAVTGKPRWRGPSLLDVILLNSLGRGGGGGGFGGGSSGGGFGWWRIWRQFWRFEWRLVKRLLLQLQKAAAFL